MGKECVICGRMVAQGRGFQLLHHFLCNDCERKIVHTDVADERYQYYVEKLAVLWRDLSMERMVP